jgi:hypothetical protein
MKNVNVTISNVIAWFEESEQCMLHNHAQEMTPTVKPVDQNIIEKILADFAE